MKNVEIYLCHKPYATHKKRSGYSYIKLVRCVKIKTKNCAYFKIGNKYILLKTAVRRIVSSFSGPAVHLLQKCQKPMTADPLIFGVVILPVCSPSNHVAPQTTLLKILALPLLVVPSLGMVVLIHLHCRVY